jgi:hypothetical protein
MPASLTPDPRSVCVLPSAHVCRLVRRSPRSLRLAHARADTPDGDDRRHSRFRGDGRRATPAGVRAVPGQPSAGARPTGPCASCPNGAWTPPPSSRTTPAAMRHNPVRTSSPYGMPTLQDRPTHSTPAHTGAPPSSAGLPPAEYDFTRGFVFSTPNGERLAPHRARRPAGDRDSSAWTIRTLLARADSARDVTVLGLVRSRVVREGGRWVARVAAR